MSARRSGAGVGVLGHTLFAVGGHDGPLVRKSVECYSVENDQWKAVSDMNYCRRNAGAFYMLILRTPLYRHIPNDESIRPRIAPEQNY